jgi:hypothetical protein
LWQTEHGVSVARGGHLRTGAIVAGYRVLGSTIAVGLLVLVGAVGSASAQRTTKLPAKLVGAWSRALTVADWRRVGIATEPAAHMSMLVSADGSVVMGESTDVRFTALLGSRVRISGTYGCGKKKALYKWSVAAGKLTFTKIQDTCNYSLALYGGPWTREKT